MGHRTSIKNPRLTKRLPLEEAETVFLNHCRMVSFKLIYIFIFY